MNCYYKTLNHLRLQLVKMSHLAKAPHLGSALSCIDLIYLAYELFLNIDPKNPNDPIRDRFILSKGHAISALYVVLAQKKFFKSDLLQTFNQNGSCLPEHPFPFCVSGIDFATGSLGHGLSLGAGLALSSKIKNKPFKVMVMLSDGELNEGSIWEAAQFIATHKLNNLIAIIDYNKWQATGESREVMQIEPLKLKWESFGFYTYEIDGHDHLEIEKTFNLIKNHPEPTMIIAHTIKGKGISFMENDNNWHYRIPSKDDLKKTQKELQIK